MLVKLVEKGRIGPETVIRGPTTHQFWSLARRVPGVAHRLGICHSCQSAVVPTDFACRNCQASFAPIPDRQHLGLMEQRWLPGHGDDPAIRAAALGGSSDRAGDAEPAPREFPEPPAEEASLPDPGWPGRGKRGSRRALIVGLLIVGGLLGSGGWWLASGPSWLKGLTGEQAAPESGRPGASIDRLPEVVREASGEEAADRVEVVERPAESASGSDGRPSESGEGEPPAAPAWAGWGELARVAVEPVELRRLASELRGRGELMKVREAIARRAVLVEAIGSR